jgi:hypothetical protein
MKPYEIKKQSEIFAVSIKSAIRARLRYLVELSGTWDNYINLKTDTVPPLSAVAALDEIIELRSYEKRCNRPERKGAITDEMIQQAKCFPVESLIEFDRAGKALAWCHADKSPSLSWNRKGNKAHCFPCGKSFNAIDILIDRDGLNFIEAVKQLAA